MDDLTVFERQFAAALQDYARSEETINHVTIAHRAATQGSLRRLSGPWRPSLAVGLGSLTMIAALGVFIALLGGPIGPANPISTSPRPVTTPSDSPETPTAPPTASSTPTAPPTASSTPTASPSLPRRPMPGMGPNNSAGLYGWTGPGPGARAGMHYVPSGGEATAMGFTVGPDCLVTTGNPEPERIEIGDLNGVSIEPYEPAFRFGSMAGDEITRAYALDVGDTTLCVFLTWHPTTTEEEIASAEATVQSLRAEPFGDGGVRIVFDLSHGWDTG